MIEGTHCCGTADYHTHAAIKTLSTTWANLYTLPAFRAKTCLTLGGMIEIFCDYIEAGIVPPGLDLTTTLQYDPQETLRAKWVATTAPYISETFPEFATFNFLESAAVCREYAAWETPYMRYSLGGPGAGSQVTTVCGAGFPWKCGFGLFTPYTEVDPASAAVSPEVVMCDANDPDCAGSHYPKITNVRKNREYDRLTDDALEVKVLKDRFQVHNAQDVNAERLDFAPVLRSDVQSFTNELCAVLNAIVIQATGSAAAVAGLDPRLHAFDFECCQCYVSWLPETGHTDDVQLGALGAMDKRAGRVDVVLRA